MLAGTPSDSSDEPCLASLARTPDRPPSPSLADGPQYKASGGQRSGRETMANDALDEIERMFGLMSEQFGVERSGVAVDVVDEDDAFVVRADLPGHDADDFDVTLTDSRTLRVTAAGELDETDGRYVSRERRQRTADRTVRLPEPVETDGTRATYDAGVLTVRLTKQTVGDEGGTDIPVDGE